MDKVIVLATGGTIAGRAESADEAGDLAYGAGQISGADLLASVPNFAQITTGVEVLCEQICNIDSKDMGYAQWQRLLQRCTHWLADPSVRGLLITHGTDTAEETAFFLHAALPPSAKPVVLTCAMRPATSAQADGPQNLADAMRVLLTPGLHGVMLVCAGQVFAADEVQKLHSYRKDAFGSPEAGPLGVLEFGYYRAWRSAPACLGLCANAGWQRDVAQWPRVEIVLNYAASSGLLVDALLAANAAQASEPTTAGSGAKAVAGIVLAGTGSGSMGAALEAALQRAEAAGVRVLRTSRCMAGRAYSGDGRPFTTSPLSPYKARIVMLLELLSL